MTPSRLDAISLANYRCFESEQRLEIRPITLIYGKNNAGKSAILRALAILARSVAETAISPWDLGDDEGPGLGAGFSALPWRGRDLKRFTLKLHWTVGSIPVPAIRSGHPTLHLLNRSYRAAHPKPFPPREGRCSTRM